MLEYHALFLLVIVGTEAFFTWLEVINLRYGEAKLDERAEWVRERFDVEDVDRLAAYERARTGLGQLSTWTVLGVVLLTLYSGLFGDAVRALQDTGLGMVGEGAAFFAGAAVFTFLLTRPFDVVSTFVVEEIFDFNEQSVRLYLRDSLISLLVTVAIAGVLGGALLWVIESFPALWAIGGAVLFLVFSLVMQVVYPRVIAPLFYDFDPLDEGDLRDAVDEVFERAGFECEQLYEMDASSRSSHSNAYFIGFGRTKRVVLFDTLIEQMDVPEIQSVLVHELTHWKRAHVWKLMGASVVQIGILLAAAQFVVAGDWLPAMFGFPASATYAELLVALFLVYPLMRWLAPLQNKLSLAFEREADDYAVEVTTVQSMVGALTTLVSENLSNPFLHPWYETFHADHPPIPERIRRLEEVPGDVSDGDEATPT